MKFKDIFLLSLNSLTHRRLRSWLTVLGIIIGVAAVVALVSIGEGLQASVAQQLGSLGANLITISPGRARAFSGFGQLGGESSAAGNLTENDLRVVKTTPGVMYIDGIASGRAEVSFMDRPLPQVCKVLTLLCGDLWKLRGWHQAGT